MGRYPKCKPTGTKSSNKCIPPDTVVYAATTSRAFSLLEARLLD